MIVPFRSTFLVMAALSASSVAPAQVNPATEPLIAEGSNELPVASATVQLPVVEAIDPLAPVADEDQARDVAAVEGETLAQTVARLRDTDPGSRELECLADAIYFEAKSESLAGQLAVGHVIANRAKSGGRFPPSYCGVLFQRGQFSFVHGRSLPSVPRSSGQWRTAVAIAKIVDQDLKDSSVGNALFFHARYVSPGWRLKRVAAIGNHIFYR